MFCVDRLKLLVYRQARGPTQYKLKTLPVVEAKLEDFWQHWIPSQRMMRKNPKSLSLLY
jgi:hypothetical protein